jgi:uncharacterized protein YeeX (DUF496 family)
MENTTTKTIATKQEEKNALLKIQKIVENLGENSYLGMAFEGIWKIAENNIENDFGVSASDYIKKCELLEHENRSLENKILYLQEAHKNEINKQNFNLNNFSKLCDYKDEIMKIKESELQEYNEKISKYESTITNLSNGIRDLEKENLILKGKIYDIQNK